MKPSHGLSRRFAVRGRGDSGGIDEATPTLALEQPGLYMPSGEPLRVAIGMRDDDPDNPRIEFPSEQIAELARDVALRGTLQPILVAPADKAGRRRIRFGSLRWRAAREAGLTEVPVVVAVEPRDACGGADGRSVHAVRHGIIAACR